PQFQVVGGTEDLPRGSALEADDRLGALQQPRPEDRVIEVGPGLVETLNRVALGGRAESEPIDLREDVPHPVRALPAARDFRERRLVVALLGLQETAEVIRVTGASHACLRLVEA